MEDFYSSLIADQIRIACRNALVADHRSDSKSLICPYCDHAIATSEIFDEVVDRENEVEVNCYNCKLMFYGAQVITYSNVSKAAMTPEEAIEEKVQLLVFLREEERACPGDHTRDVMPRMLQMR